MRFAPHRGHRPAQSGRHRGAIGSSSTIASVGQGREVELVADDRVELLVGEAGQRGVGEALVYRDPQVPDTGSAQRPMPTRCAVHGARDVDPAHEGDEGHVALGLCAGRAPRCGRVDPCSSSGPASTTLAAADLAGRRRGAAQPRHVNDEGVRGHHDRAH